MPASATRLRLPPERVPTRCSRSLQTEPGADLFDLVVEVPGLVAVEPGLELLLLVEQRRRGGGVRRGQFFGDGGQPLQMAAGAAESGLESAADRQLGIEFRLLAQVARLQPALAQQLAVVGRFQPGENAQQGRLATAVAADQTELLPLPHREVHGVEDGAGAVTLVQVLEIDDIHGRESGNGEVHPGGAATSLIHPCLPKAKGDPGPEE